jgi:hypothetical protein
MSEPSTAPTDHKKICLLLTGTVDVSGIHYSMRNDPIERLNDYRSALEQWVRSDAVDRIVFVENSGYDITPLRSVVERSSLPSSSVEFLSFQGQDFPRNLGKGYGENLNVEYAISHSEMLATDEYLIVRANGRQYYENISSFFRAMYPSTEILCDLWQNLTWGDVRILGGTMNFFQNYACPFGREVDDSRGYYYEHAMARAVHRGMADGLVWTPYPEPPLIRGFSGTSNQSVVDGRVTRARRRLKHRLKLRLLR